jgi:hypothetical protein
MSPPDSPRCPLLDKEDLIKATAPKSRQATADLQPFVGVNGSSPAGIRAPRSVKASVDSQRSPQASSPHGTATSPRGGRRRARGRGESEGPPGWVVYILMAMGAGLAFGTAIVARSRPRVSTAGAQAGRR